MRLRISFTFAAVLVAIAALTVGVTAASADNPPINENTAFRLDPQNTNIPYVAWVGEQVKIAKCLDLTDAEHAALTGLISSDPLLTTGKFVVEDWSGVNEVNAGPKFLNDSNGDVRGQIVAGQRAGDPDRLCYSVHITSQKAGLAVVKLTVRPDLLGLLPGLDPILKHQFLVIFLRSQAPSIVEVATAGDPGGLGTFNPIPNGDGTNSFQPGLVKLNVKGTFPLGNDFAGIAPGDSVTLPDDWAFLASKFAVDASRTGSAFPGAVPQRWDIHDDQSLAEGHSPGSFCLTGTAAVDGVDNCLGGGMTGAFSRLIGGGTRDTIGPFDPLRPDQTLLLDGKLDAGDAPMPALQINVSLGAASSVGSLSKADKTDIYLRNAAFTKDSPHNLYAPFYRSYIPATGDQSGNSDNRSGVAGSIANNYGGFLAQARIGPEYDFWATFRLNSREGSNACYDVDGRFFGQPTGDSAVAVYTDEHGEAYVQFNPNVGENLTPDSNGRCDIFRPGVLGTATIQARSVYPDQPVLSDQDNKLSSTLTKTVNSLANKTLACVPKGTNEAFCVETIRNIEGNPVSGASVEFTAQAGQGSQPKIQPDAAKVASFDTRGQGILSASSNAVRLTTNALGQAGISVVSSTNACINVDAENIGTRNGGAGIFRFADFNPTTGLACNQGGTTPPPPAGGGTPPASGGTPPASGGTPPASGGTPPASSGTPAAVSAAAVAAAPVALSAPVPTASAPTSAPAKVTKAAKATLVSGIVVKTKTGRYLKVRVNSASKSATLRITLLSKHGKVSRVVMRAVATNRTVRVANLKLAPSVRSVRVAIA